MGKSQQNRWGFVNGTHEFRSVLRCFFEQLICDAFEVARRFLRPAQLHLAVRLPFGNELFQPRAYLFVG
jgi:hypothetical protein